MRVLVTGAYGLIGSSCLARLHRDGHDLTGSGRSTAEAERRYPFARWIEADFNTLFRRENWEPLLQGFDALVNCVGALQDSARDDVRRVQFTATAALFAACEMRSIRRVVHISALGADASGPTEFARSKAEAEADLARRDLDWVILRPALVLAPAAYGGTAMLRALAAVPLVTPVVCADVPVQVVDAGDLADTVAGCLAPGAPSRVTWDVAHPERHTLGSIVAALRGWLGFPPRPLLPLPRWVGLVVAAAADALGWLGWRSPARTTAFAQLTRGVTGDPVPWMSATRIVPKSLGAALAAMPATVQERWFARLYLLKPLAIAAIALFWAGTGVVTLWPGRAAAEAQLAATGFAPSAVTVTVVLGALFDIVLGLLLLVRRLARPVLILMLTVTPFYLLTGTLLAPQLWLDPLGPLLKVVPIMIAMLFALAILDER